MCRKLFFLVFVVFVLGLANSASAAQAPFKVDFGLEGHLVPEGFFEISGGPGTSPEPWIVDDVGGTGIDVTLRTTIGHALGFRDNGFHPLFGDGIFPDNYPDHALIVTLSGLDPAKYTFTGYHNQIAGREGGLIDIYVNEEVVLEEVVQSGIGPGGDFSNPGTSNFEFTIAQGQTSVEFKFVPAAAHPNDVWLNGLVIDYTEVPFAWWPRPSDGANNVGPDVVLGWTPGMDAARHDVYFGTDYNNVNDATDPNTPPGRGRQAYDANTYDPSGLLDLSRTYYWRIDEVDGIDTQTGEVWSFTVNDGRACDPMPNNGIWGVPIDANISWAAGALATSHDVYFGTDFDDVNDATDPNTLPGRGRQAGTSYNTGGLESGTTYYWRIDEHGPLGDFRGEMWKFSTVGAVVLHYKFDETEGSIAFDSSGRGLDGMVGGPCWDPDGYVDGCLGFDVGTGVSSPLSLLEHIGKEITVAVWLYGAESPSASGYWPDNEVFQTGGFGEGGSWEGFMAASIPMEETENQVVRFMAGYGPNDVVVWYDCQPSDWQGGWNHYAFVKDENEQIMRIYHNGEAVAEKQGGLIDSLAYFRDREFLIGRGVRPLSSQHFEGKMDDFRIYDSALSAARISRLYRVGTDLGLAWAPKPIDGDKDVPTEVILTWRPGDYAQAVNAHEVYFGTDLDAVSNATDPNTLPGRGRQDPNWYDPPGPLELGGTYYWRIDEVNETHPNSPWKGEVWSFTVDEGKAHSPSPDSLATNVPPDANLSWSAGDYAAWHEVYFGTDAEAMRDATDPNTPPGRGRRSTTSYDPGALEFDQTYYWRIDEVNPGYVNSKGDVWAFTTIQYTAVVDDMESYNQTDNRINDTWKDGYWNTTGAEVYIGIGTGENPAPVYDGNQSMLYMYDNNDPWEAGVDYYSEIEVDTSMLPIGSDWTGQGVRALMLFFYGDPDNDANEQMYVGLEDTRGSYAQVNYGYYGEDMNDIKEDEWHQWDIALSDFTAVDANNVKKLYIGFGIRGNPNPGGTPGGSGFVYFDDIRLCPPRCLASIAQPGGDLNDDCIVDLKDLKIMAGDWLERDLVDVTAPNRDGLLVEYTFDTDCNDTSGNERHGIPTVDAVVSDGKLVLDGGPGSYVDIPLDGANPFDGTDDYSIQMTFASTECNEVLLSSATFMSTRWDYPMMFWVSRWDRPVAYPQVHIWYRGGASASGIVDFSDGMMHSTVVTFNATTDAFRFYSDGFDDGSVLLPHAIPSIEQHVVRIGVCPSYAFRKDMEVSSFAGEIDSLRIFNYVLSEPEVMYVITDGTGILPIVAPANVYNEEPPGSRAVNFRDLAKLMQSWGEEELWPAEQ